MKSITRLVPHVALCFVFSTLAFAQQKTASNADKKSNDQIPSRSRTAHATPRQPLSFGLLEDTPVRMTLTRTMSSKDAKPNDKVDFEVLEDIKLGDTVVIRHGALAIGTVTEAHPKRRMGRAGKLNINIDYVQLVSGEKVPLRAVKGGNGGSHTAAMTGAMVATGILFFPAAPLFLFMHGNNITIPKGTEITAYVAADTPLDPAKLSKQVAARGGGGGQPSIAGSDASLISSVSIKSEPAGAEITIDGKFIGTTPSSVQLKPGEHTVLIEKVGFKSWQKTMTVSAGGFVSLDATLDKVP